MDNFRILRMRGAEAPDVDVHIVDQGIVEEIEETIEGISRGIVLILAYFFNSECILQTRI